MKKLLLLPLLLAACAKPHVVDVVQPYDEELNCAGLKAEMAKLDTFRAEAEKEKGVTGGNAMRALVFPIGIWATYENVNDAVSAANQREVYLTGLMTKKDC